jgi:MerR-like DNA binding protein
MAGGGVRGLTIGEAVARLVAEFPGLTVSVLRRLESEGLVEPVRTPNGYRRYSPADLERVRAALSGIQDPLWPDSAAVADEAAMTSPASARAPQSASARTTATPRLPSSRTPSSGRPAAVPVGARVGVSQRSGAGRSGAAAVATTAPATSVPQASAASSRSAGSTGSGGGAGPAPRRPERRWPEAEFFTPDLGEVALNRDQLAAAARADRAWVDGLVEFGLLPEGEPVGGAELLVARASAELAQFGVEPRHLRAVAASAARVAELVAAATSPAGGRDPARRERSLLASPGRSAEAAAAAVRLHAALVRAALLRA